MSKAQLIEKVMLDSLHRVKEANVLIANTLKDMKNTAKKDSTFTKKQRVLLLAWVDILKQTISIQREVMQSAFDEIKTQMKQTVDAYPVESVLPSLEASQGATEATKEDTTDTTPQDITEEEQEPVQYPTDFTEDTTEEA